MHNYQTQDYYNANKSARFLTLLVICIGSFLTPLSVSAVLVAVPAIAAELKLSAVYVSWIPVTFVLSNLVMMVPAGRLADLYGRKRLYLLGFSTFGISSLCAGLADNIAWLLFFRSLQGASSAFFFSSGFAIIGSIFRDSGRGTALGWLAASVYLGLTCGPLIGGWVTETLGWRWVFFFSIPFILACLFLSIAKMKGEWKAEGAESLDIVGAALLGIGLFTLFLAVSNLHKLQGWLLLGVSIPLFYGFIQRCQRVSNPVIRVDAVRKNTLLHRSLLASASMYSGHFAIIFIIGLYLQFNLDLTPTAAGKILLLQAIMMTVSAPIAGRLSEKYQARYQATIGCLINTLVFLGFLLMFLLSPDVQPLVLICVLMAFSGIGHGFFATPNNNAVLGSVHESRLGIASAMLNQARTLGQMLGTAFISLMMSMFIGQAEITPQHYPAFYEVTVRVVAFAFLFACCGAAFSFFRDD